MSEATTINLYEVLEVPEDATDDQIREAVKSQRKVWVLRQNAPSLERRQEAERHLANIAQADKVLLDPGARAQHDRGLRAQPRTQHPRQALDGADEWMTEAAEALRRGDFSRASWAAREATHHYPRDPEAWALRARANCNLGNLNDAMHEFRRSKDLEPHSAHRHYELGTVLQALDQWTPAMDSFTEATRLAPTEPYYKVAVAGHWVRGGDAAAGVRILEPLATAHEQDKNIQRAYAHALMRAGFDHWQRMPDGGYYPTTKEGAEQSLALWRRAQNLSFDDDSIREELSTSIARSEWALKRRWAMSFRTVMTLLVLSAIVASAVESVHGLLVLPVFIACLGGIITLALKPNYQRVARDLKSRFGHVG